jgi:hypothetical protein
MNIIKYNQFILENFHDSPEEYVKIALSKIKKKIEKMFEVPAQIEETDYDSDAETVTDVESVNKITTMSDALKRGKEEDSKKSTINLSDFGLELQSSELSKYSSTLDNIKIIFSDEEFRYDLYITIPLEEAIVKDKTKDFTDKDIEKCYVKFKKYHIDSSELLGQISKNTKISNIDEDFLVDLKIQIEDEFGDDFEKIEIET